MHIFTTIAEAAELSEVKVKDLFYTEGVHIVDTSNAAELEKGLKELAELKRQTAGNMITIREEGTAVKRYFVTYRPHGAIERQYSFATLEEAEEEAAKWRREFGAPVRHEGSILQGVKNSN